MLPNGVCGLTVKRKTYEDSGPDVEKGPGIKLRGKLLKRIRKEDII